ncbi:hypothetical protein MNEG_13010, partial [Monoraphidium neglectum]
MDGSGYHNRRRGYGHGQYWSKGGGVTKKQWRRRQQQRKRRQRRKQARACWEDAEQEEYE